MSLFTMLWFRQLSTGITIFLHQRNKSITRILAFLSLERAYFISEKNQYIMKLQNHAVCYSLFLGTEKAKVSLFLIQHHAMKT
jgi:hypothetical protein